MCVCVNGGGGYLIFTLQCDSVSKSANSKQCLDYSGDKTRGAQFERRVGLTQLTEVV